MDAPPPEDMDPYSLVDDPARQRRRRELMEHDAQKWRESVVGTLAKIESQLGRMASDRESEKATLQRATQRLDEEDRRHTERLERHVEWNDAEHEKFNEKHNKLAGRMTFFMGAITALQFVAPFIWQSLLK